MLKVLYLPLGDQPSTVEAFQQAKTDVKIFDFWTKHLNNESHVNIRNEFIKTAKKFKPDLIHMQLHETLIVDDYSLEEVKKELPNTIISNWWGDVRDYVCNEFVRVGKVIDYSLLCNKTTIPQYQAAGCKNVKYWQIGYNPKVYYPQNKTSFKYDVSFVGNSCTRFENSNFRNQIGQILKKKYGERAGIFGNGWKVVGARPVSHPECNNIYNDSLCVISISNMNLDHYFSDRLLHCLASGRPTISHYFNGYDSYWGHGKDILIGKNVDEIISLIEWCKSNPEEANIIGQSAALCTQSQHTYRSRVLELLDIVGLR